MEITYDLRASAWRRLANYLIDYLIQIALVFCVGLVAGALYRFFDMAGPYNYITNMNRIEEFLLGALVGFGYYFIFEAANSRTLGKYITGTKVVTWHGEKPTVGRIAKRTLCRLIPLEIFSFLAERPLGWHDSISDTVVVDVKRYEEELALKNSFEEIGAVAE